ncbi:MAG: hypothetical protein KJ893_11320, partial [Candidatus Omnitrophica bacterium]|nr:hypothetical protein [Candidatus Omnitrophota bacterium]
ALETPYYLIDERRLLRNLKIINLSFLICFVFLSSPLNIFAEVLTGKSYQETLHKHLSQAENQLPSKMLTAEIARVA